MYFHTLHEIVPSTFVVRSEAEFNACQKLFKKLGLQLVPVQGDTQEDTCSDSSGEETEEYSSEEGDCEKNDTQLPGNKVPGHSV